ncbi:MAG TPA: hypothetical protein VNK41_03495 [Vicinamibacterales bacterium]|nr:hypothetical protein [Vicinamibacterales bacterium]
MGDDASHARSDEPDPRPGGAPFTIELKTAPPAYDADGRPLDFRFERLEWVR